MLIVNELQIWPGAAQDSAPQQNLHLQSQEDWVRGEGCWHHIVVFLFEGGCQ